MLIGSAMCERSAATLVAVLFTAVLVAPALGADGPNVHLFILSGQSNMAGLDPAVSFTPAVKKAFADGEVIVVKDAAGGQPIRRWYKNWKPAGGEQPKGNGDLYDRLLGKVKTAIAGKKPDTVTFVWMQGESDSRAKQGEVYAASLRGLIEQLRADLGRKDVNVVIGRISDYSDAGFPDWEVVRKALVEVAESDPRAAWVDTDDLNGPKNDLHYNADGYKVLGERFAQKATELIKSGPKQATPDEKPNEGKGK